VLRESRFSHDTPEIAYLAPLGLAITLRGIVYGKDSKRKKEECILFSLKTFSHKTVSNHSVVILLRGLCGLLKALSDAEGERPCVKSRECPAMRDLRFAPTGERQKRLSYIAYN